MTAIAAADRFDPNQQTGCYNGYDMNNTDKVLQALEALQADVSGLKQGQETLLTDIKNLKQGQQQQVWQLQG